MYALCPCRKPTEDPGWLFVERMEFGKHAGHEKETGEPLACKFCGAYWAKLCYEQKFTWRGMQKMLAEVEALGQRACQAEDQGTADELQKLLQEGKTKAEALRELADREEKRQAEIAEQTSQEAPVEKLSLEEKKKLLERISAAQKLFDESLKKQETQRELLVQAEQKHQANEAKLLQLRTQNELDEALLRQQGARDVQQQIEAERAKQEKPFSADVSKLKLEPDSIVDQNAMQDGDDQQLKNRVGAHNKETEEAEQERLRLLAIDKQITELQQQKAGLQKILEPKIVHCKNEYKELVKMQAPKEPEKKDAPEAAEDTDPKRRRGEKGEQVQGEPQGEDDHDMGNVETEEGESTTGGTAGESSAGSQDPPSPPKTEQHNDSGTATETNREEERANTGGNVPTQTNTGKAQRQQQEETIQNNISQKKQQFEQKLTEERKKALGKVKGAPKKTAVKAANASEDAQ